MKYIYTYYPFLNNRYPSFLIVPFVPFVPLSLPQGYSFKGVTPSQFNTGEFIFCSTL